MTPLRRKFVDEMKILDLSPRTINSYTNALADLARHYNLSPDKIGEDKIRQYIIYLVEERKLKYSTCNVAISAIRMFYNNVLGVDELKVRIPCRKKGKSLPTVLAVEEVEDLLSAVENPKHRVLLMTAYAAGRGTGGDDASAKR